MSIDYKTLIEIQKTQAIDVWYLFSTSGFYRNVPIYLDKLPQKQTDRITKILGSDEWIEYLFIDQVQTEENGQRSLFSENVSEQLPKRASDVASFERYVMQRLKTIFPSVSEAFPLPPVGAQLYSLFFLVSNPSPQARGLAQKISKHILDSYRPK